MQDFGKAETHFQEQSYLPASELYLKVYNTDPAGIQAAESLYKTGFCYFKLQKYPDAETTFSRVITEFPKNFWAAKSHVGIAQLKWETNRWGSYEQIAENFKMAKDIFKGLDPKLVKNELINLYFQEAEYLKDWKPPIPRSRSN